MPTRSACRPTRRARSSSKRIWPAQHDNLDLNVRIASAAQQQADAARAEEHAAALCCGDPGGEAAELLGQLRAQLSAGVDPGRLAVLIEAAGQEDMCRNEPVTKRFMPRTPVSAGPLSWVRFDDRITVTGEGESARSETGLAEAWYDLGTAHSPAIRTFGGEITTNRQLFHSTIEWRSMQGIGSARSASRPGSSK